MVVIGVAVILVMAAVDVAVSDGRIADPFGGTGVSPLDVALQANLLLNGLWLFPSAQRLHDMGQSAWMLLILLVPGFNLILVITMLVAPSQPGANRFGPLPTRGYARPTPVFVDSPSQAEDVTRPLVPRAAPRPAAASARPAFGRRKG